jgi:hypothetical protein
MSKLIYCATPSRIIHKMKKIMDLVTDEGYAPLHPFQAFPYKRFEGNPKIGRIKSMQWCLNLIDISDEFWMFGISDGTLEEVAHAIKIEKPIRLRFDGFDNNWERFYKKLGKNYGNPLDYLIARESI